MIHLLKRSIDDSLTLHPFNEDALPPYAAISHTWDHGQEVTYRELISGKGRDRRGYAKIILGMDIAARDGLQYIWINTCCVDKSERLEDVKWVYRLFQRAAKCYVLLSTVRVRTGPADPEASRTTWEVDFRQSSWFILPWTLQELLAPSQLEFFSAEGILLGSRVHLEQQIFQITGIPIAALRGFDISSFSVEEVFSWASRRTPSRRENRVYCLLGLFGVFMPFAYGEGEIRATQRLKDEIWKTRKELRPAITEREYFLHQSNTLLDQFTLHGSLKDLQGAIQLVQDTVKKTPTDKSADIVHLTHLTTEVKLRLDKVWGMYSSGTTIHMIQMTLMARSIHSSGRARSSDILIGKLELILELISRLSQLEEVIQSTQEALSVTHDEDNQHTSLLEAPSDNLKLRFDCSGDLQDLEDAISFARETLHATRRGSSHRTKSLERLGELLEKVLKRELRWDYLQEAIRRTEELIETTPERNQEHFSRLARLRRKIPPTFIEDGLYLLSLAAEPGAFAKKIVPPKLSSVRSMLDPQGDIIGSKVSTISILEKNNDEALVTFFLGEDTLVNTLCNKALTYTDKLRYTNNLEQILRSLHKNLSEEASTETEKALVGLIRRRPRRLRIINHLINQIQMGRTPSDRKRIITTLGGYRRMHQLDKYTVLGKIQVDERGRLSGLGPHERLQTEDSYPPKVPDPSKEQDRRNEWELLKFWCTTVSVAPADLPEQYSEDDNSCEGSTEPQTWEEYPFTLELAYFLDKSNSFKSLRRDLILWFLPLDIRQVVLSTASRNIRFSRTEGDSIVNSAKGWIEDTTNVKWDWWPLKERKRALRDHETRLIWNCACGEQQWMEIPAEYEKPVTLVLKYVDGTALSPQWCRKATLSMPLATWFVGLFGAALTLATGSSSSAAAKYKPPNNDTVISDLRPPGSRHSALIPSIPAQPTSPTVAQTGSSIPASPDRETSYVLFGVEGWRPALFPSQIPVDQQSTDASLFTALKKHYRYHRGWLRSFFSLWQLDCCAITKFERVDLREMDRECFDLPKGSEYKYNPRAGDPQARNPPLRSHRFKKHYYTCEMSCRKWLLHRCSSPPNTREVLTRFPKRTSSFEEDLTKEIWGVEAIFAVSVLHVVCYHIMILFGPFVFFFWWISVHPTDLQNAVVPATIAIGGLSLLWLLSEILPGGRARYPQE